MRKTFIEDWRQDNDLDEPDRRPASMESAFDFIVEQLNAFRHLSYGAYAGNEDDDDWEERGDILLCADFRVFSPVEYHPDYDNIDPVWVAYHVMKESESGAFSDKCYLEIVPASKAPFALVLNMTDLMDDMCQTEDEYKSAQKLNEKWNRDLKAAIELEMKAHRKRAAIWYGEQRDSESDPV